MHLKAQKAPPPPKDTFASFDIQSTDVVLAVDMNIHAEITPQRYSTVIVGGDPKLRRQPASHRLMRVPSNVPQSLRSGVQAIEITFKPAVNSSTR
jgi:hypothetical protein